MNSITIWITQIIIFLIIATIVSLIIPNNRMKASIQTILGLLLLLTFAKPLLYIFTIDLGEPLDQVEKLLVEDSALTNDIDNSFKKQKNEIQATQDAYILSEVERQLIAEANPLIIESFDMNITSVTIHFTEPREEVISIDDFEFITVYITGNEAVRPTEHIEPIIIDTKNEREVDELDGMNEVRQALAEIWGIDQSQIQLNKGGGTS